MFLFFVFFFLSEAAIVNGLAAKPQSRSLRYEKQNPSGTQGRARKVRKFSLFFSRPFEVFETFSVAPLQTCLRPNKHRRSMPLMEH